MNRRIRIIVAALSLVMLAVSNAALSSASAATLCYACVDDCDSGLLAACHAMQ